MFGFTIWPVTRSSRRSSKRSKPPPYQPHPPLLRYLSSPPPASAIANAVRNATGATIRSLPLHPHKVLAALEQQKAGGRTDMKAFAYVNPANEKEAVAALKVAASRCRLPAARTCSRG